MSEVFDVVLTGGSSPLGDHALPALLATGAKVAVTARSRAATDRLARSGCAVLRVDLEAPPHVMQVRAGTLLHLAGIRYSAGASKLAKDIEAERIIAISSASAAAPDHPLRDSILSWEQEAGSSGAQVAILRPTMIYGSSRDRTIQRLYRLTQRLQRVPRVSGGGFLMPVLVDDVVSAILETLQGNKSAQRPVAGPDRVRLGDIVDAICSSTDAPRLPITLPLGPAVRAAGWGGGRPGKARHAVQMLGFDRVVSSPWQAGFTYEPTRLTEGVALAISRYPHQRGS